MRSVLNATFVLSVTLLAALRADGAIVFGEGANTFTMEFVAIGNPGNPADTAGDPNPAGSVNYLYGMSKFAVSREMVAKASTLGSLGISLSDMSSRGGNGPNKPATGVSWNETARFANWLNTSQGFSPAYKFQFQPGEAAYGSNAFALPWNQNDLGFDALNPIRNSQAKFFLPSVDEWFKAAYFDPHSDSYFAFPTGTNTAPTAVASGTEPNTAVYSQPESQGPADIMEAGGLSPHGIMSLGSNIWEWEETEFDLVNDNSSTVRGLRGNRWFDTSFNMMSSRRGFFSAQVEDSNTGFRVATTAVPEPSSVALVALTAMGIVSFSTMNRSRIRHSKARH